MLLSIGLSWWLGAAPSQAAGPTTAVTLSQNPIQADGTSATMATATVTTDGLLPPIPGDSVVITSDKGQTITPAGPQTTDPLGQVAVTITSTITPGVATITADDLTSGVSGTVILTQTPPPPPPPTYTPPPAAAISGAPQVGATLTAAHGSWTGGPSFTYQWESCSLICVPVTAAGPSNKYKLTAADVNSTIEVVVTATNGGGSASTTAGPTALVTGAPANTAPPTITGSPAPGQTLTAANGGWSNFPTSFSYQWVDCDSSGANCVPSPTTADQTTYAVTALDLGHTVRVLVTASNAVGPSAPAASPQTGVVVQFSSTTSLSAAPTSSVTNGGVKLTATVTSSVGAVAPAGHVTFYNGSAQIGGCANVPVVGSGGTATATCQTSFAASTSPEALGAAFAADRGSSVADSQSPTVRLAVGKDSTSTALDVSNLTVKTGSSTTYTATVSPGHAGPFRPAGSVEFLDGGKPISFCLRQGLGGSPASSATCTVRYRKKGTHRITAIYGGDANFTGAPVSPVLKVSVRKLRTGTITSTMQWTFFFTPAYTKVLTLVVNGPPLNGTVLVECHGKGCPFVKRTTPVAMFKSCISKGGKLRCSVRKPKTVNLMRGFRKHHLHVGAKITVELLRPNFIGKNYVFKVRSGSAPQIQIRCLAPGAKHPGVGC